jgi:hypothetical protein
MEYFHVTNESPQNGFQPFRVGDSVETSRTKNNPFYQAAADLPAAFTIGKNIEIPILEFFRKVEAGELDQTEPLKNYKAIAHLAEIFLGNYIKLVRELHFESIRQIEFPDRPSRKHCIWLSRDFEGAKYWLGRLSEKTGRKIVRVSVEGTTFETNEGHLIADAEPVNKIFERATKYWQGEPGTGKVEILFEGRMKILEIIC